MNKVCISIGIILLMSSCYEEVELSVALGVQDFIASQVSVLKRFHRQFSE